MSWQATAWAVEQQTGSSQSKCILLLLANRADENGICWPSQASLAAQAEQSEDTVQRHLRRMEGRFILRARAKRTKGRWPGYVYQLLMPHVRAAHDDDLQNQPVRKRIAREAIRRAKSDPLPGPLGDPQTDSTTPLSAARSMPLPAVSPGRSLRPHQAAESGVEPITEPSDEPSIVEPSPAPTAAPSLEREARRGNSRARLDHIHSQLAQRLGPDGWSILQRLSPDDLAQLEMMQRHGTLTDAALAEVRHDVRG